MYTDLPPLDSDMSLSLSVKLTVLLSGQDAVGAAFEERTRTAAIEEVGGRLLTRQRLAQGARLQLRLLARPDRAVEIALERALQESPEASEWAFRFAEPAADFWGVRFPGSSEAPTAQGVLEVTEQLVLLSSHAEDHLRHCRQEMEVLRQRFTRELQSTLDAGGRQLQQLARSTMQTTFRSLLEDLARRAEETVEDNLAHLRAAVDESRTAYSTYLTAETEAELKKFVERVEKQGRALAAQLDEQGKTTERALAEKLEQALGEFQAGCAELLTGLGQSFTARKPARAARK